MDGKCAFRIMLGACLSAFCATAHAQSPESNASAVEAAEQVALETIPEADAETDPETGNNPEMPNPDESADLLNSRQQLQQNFTLKRTINGEVVESEKRTVTYSRGDPYRATEADRESITDVLRSEFDGKLLTRNEAFEEAKIDFIIADADRNGAVDADEFAALVASWADNDARNAEAPTEDIARQRRYDAFLSEIGGDNANVELKRDLMAKQKFTFMAGAAQTLSREDYIREYLLDFDTMDTDNDGQLKDEELRRFRAVSRGESLAEDSVNPSGVLSDQSGE